MNCINRSMNNDNKGHQESRKHAVRRETKKERSKIESRNRSLHYELWSNKKVPVNQDNNGNLWVMTYVSFLCHRETYSLGMFVHKMKTFGIILAVLLNVATVEQYCIEVQTTPNHNVLVVLLLSTNSNSYRHQKKNYSK